MGTTPLFCAESEVSDFGAKSGDFAVHRSSGVLLNLKFIDQERIILSYLFQVIIASTGTGVT